LLKSGIKLHETSKVPLKCSGRLSTGAMKHAKRFLISLCSMVLQPESTHAVMQQHYAVQEIQGVMGSVLVQRKKSGWQPTLQEIYF
jgi:hypothetical protein